MSVGFCGRAHVNTTVCRFKQQHPKSNAGRSVMVPRREMKEGFATSKKTKKKQAGLCQQILTKRPKPTNN